MKLGHVLGLRVARHRFQNRAARRREGASLCAMTHEFALHGARCGLPIQCRCRQADGRKAVESHRSPSTGREMEVKPLLA